jgi:hypothetical protein
VWRGFRAFAAFVAAFTMLSFSAQTLHMLLVPHRFCPVHHVFEHAEPGTVTAKMPTAPHPVPAVSGDQAQHDACHALATHPGVTAEPRGVVTGIVSVGVATAEIRSVVFVRPIWALAPKTSPPV